MQPMGEGLARQVAREAWGKKKARGVEQQRRKRAGFVWHPLSCSMIV